MRTEPESFKTCNQNAPFKYRLATGSPHEEIRPENDKIEATGRINEARCSKWLLQPGRYLATAVRLKLESRVICPPKRTSNPTKVDSVL